MKKISIFTVIVLVTSLFAATGCQEAKDLADDASSSYNKLSNEVVSTKENIEGTIKDVTETVDNAKKVVDDTVNTVKTTAETVSETASGVKDQADQITNNL